MGKPALHNDKTNKKKPMKIKKIKNIRKNKICLNGLLWCFTVDFICTIPSCSTGVCVMVFPAGINERKINMQQHAVNGSTLHPTE